ncbi:unnamed protein product [Linum trigynum]|uniref:Ubiquitin-like domain-containing protein n=1 Tax=Linum trigynum TaxID=586398 RepID=A0AAV2DEX0_9ROSI
MNGGSSSGGGGSRSNSGHSGSGSGSDSDDEAATGFLFLNLGDYSLSYCNASLNMSAAELKEWVNEHYGVPTSRIKLYQESHAAAEDGDLMDDRRTMAYYGFTKHRHHVYHMRVAEQRQKALIPCQEPVDINNSSCWEKFNRRSYTTTLIQNTPFFLWVSESGVDGHTVRVNVTEATTVAQLKDKIREKLRDVMVTVAVAER